jgi:ABC-type branched-subunit amino acid transport system substrate-binding protein/DNA-binding beta-propeller fold protein YncE/predicted Ser/Thr protein kinase
VVHDLGGAMTTTRLAPGSTFAGYRIESEIGRGGMGVVYRAIDLRLERPVALKLISPELAQDEEFRKRFLRESKLAASLGHPHVLPVYAAGEEEGQLYLAMRYVEGEDLKTLLAREKKLDPERAFRICRQVAEALDVAHRRGLVHRDVKPANVLLDEEGEAYLADFGLTKQVGGASTQTGQIVGTLDYVAPEQIRGDELDGRTDEYALACVVYECLAGKPPFRRPTEPEVLWAHMQEEPPALKDYPVLDPVFRRGLAKDKAERFSTCSGLVDTAREGLGFETPRLHRRRRLVRRSRILAVAGTLVLAGAIAALTLELTGGGSGEITVAENSLVEINPRTGRVEAAIGVGRTPSVVAVRQDAVWVLNADDKTVSKIDPKARRVEGTFGLEGTPTDLAVGRGGVWIVSDGIVTGAGPLTVTRIDPGTGAHVASVRLTPPPSPATIVGTLPHRQIAVGSSGVWLAEPLTGGLWRIDPRTNKVRTRVTGFTPRALTPAGRGLWLANPDSSVLAVTARGRRAQRIAVTATTLDDVAYGDGAIWALDRPDGTLWRIDPGARPVSRTIPVGIGASSVAYGEGSVWVANGFDGTVLRIDPAENRVVQTIGVGGVVRAIAAGNGAVWVTVSGPGALRESACGPVLTGDAGKPDYLITSDFPLQFVGRKRVGPAAQAIELVLRQHGFRAGRYKIGYQSCDDSLAQTGDSDPYKCAANARSFAADARVIGMIGPLISPCAKVEIPIANRASLPMISPSNSWPGLTRAGPGTERGEPDKYYPTGVRTYFRVEESDVYQAAADAMLAKQLGAKKVFVLRLFVPHAAGGDYPLTMAAHFERAAKRLGLAVVGSSRWMDGAKTYRGLVSRVARARPDAVFLGGWLCGSCGELLEELRAQLGRRVAIIAPDGFFPPNYVFEAAGEAAVGMYVSLNQAPTTALPPPAQRFIREFSRRYPEAEIGDFPPWVPYTAQATEALLAAIARSDGTRLSVVRELHELRIVDGILGTFRFDQYGDSTLNYTTIVRVVKKPPPGSDIARGVIDRVLALRPGLVR